MTYFSQSQWLVFILYGLANLWSASAETVRVPNAQVLLIDELAIPAEEGGILREILVSPGELVKSKQLLGKMDDRQLVIQREAAQLEAELARIEQQNDIDLRYAEKSEAVARAELERMNQANRAYARSVTTSELAQARLVAERALLAAEQAQRDLQAKQVSVRLKEKQVELLEGRISKMRLQAPNSGMITELVARPGEWIPLGAPAFRMVRLDRLRVKAFVDGNRFDQSLKGTPVVFSTQVPPEATPLPFEGRITFVSPRVIPNSGQLEVWADVDNPNARLRPGSQGILTITIP